MKVCLRPTPDQLSATNGIGRVVFAQYRYLPQYGIEFVREPNAADLCVGHTDYYDMPRLDVLHAHGLYWTGDIDSGKYDGYHLDANRHIVQAARMAHTITVPSQWVAMPFKRDMRINPIVIGHGIDFDQWQPADPGDFVLWNKNRPLDVCRPDAPYELARRGLNVVSTFGPEGVQWPQTLMVIGKQDEGAMRQFISQASVYLSTTKETFGIGTLEAMACGVPVVGWDYGGTADIVTSGHDGILVKPGDYDALYKAVLDAQKRRAELGKNARETARRYDWKYAIELYARLYEMVLQDIRQEKHGISVIITNYNYARFVGEAIKSVLAQTRPVDELIVVDDGSSDNSLQVIRETLSAAEPAAQCQVIAQANQGVAAARTAGIIAASQPFICCLDADDKLAPEFIATLLPAIQARRDLGIVYSGLTLFDYEKSWQAQGFPPPFDWGIQSTAHNPPSNCIPSACIFRKSMWYRAGPHRQEYAPGEDAEFWTRGLSTGFNAERVTDAGLFWYRLHGESATRRLKYKPIDDRLPWMNDKQYPFAAPAKFVPPVRSYSAPKVSIIIPVGPGHAQYVSDAIESVIAQTMREWECIVIDDTLDTEASWIVERYPFVTYLYDPAKRRTSAGAGAARNSGIAQAKAPFVLFLDADDILEPSALEEMLIAHVNSGGRYIYCDVLKLSQDGKSETLPAANYEQRIWQDDGLHSVTCLIPTAWARDTLFNATLKTWEEGDFFTRLAQAGCCGQRLERPLLIWREWTGRRHRSSKKQKQAALAHQKTLEGIEMSNCGCGPAGETIMEAKQALSGMTVRVETQTKQGEIQMEYVGDLWGPITFIGSKRREYRGGKDTEHKFVSVLPEDVKRLELSGQWKIAG